MKKFSFRLEKVLEHKCRLFDIAKEEYMKENRKLLEANAKLEAIKNEYQDCLLKLLNRTKEKFNIKELSIYYKYIFYKKVEIKAQIGVVEKLAKKVNEKRQALVDASKEKEILIKLKGRKRRDYMQKLSLEEQKFLDEISSGKYIRDKIATRAL